MGTIVQNTTLYQDCILDNIQPGLSDAKTACTESHLKDPISRARKSANIHDPTTTRPTPPQQTLKPGASPYLPTR